MTDDRQTRYEELLVQLLNEIIDDADASGLILTRNVIARNLARKLIGLEPTDWPAYDPATLPRIASSADPSSGIEVRTYGDGVRIGVEEKSFYRAAVKLSRRELRELRNQLTWLLDEE